MQHKIKSLSLGRHIRSKKYYMKPLTIDDQKLMTIAIQQEIQRSDESRYDHKLHGVLLIANGYDSYEVGHMFDQDPTTIQRWVRKFNESGFDGLRDGQRPGRPKSLSDKQWEQLEIDLRKLPSSFKYSQTFWDGKLLSRHLKRRYKIKLGTRQCQRIFTMMGFRLRKPRPVIAQGDSQAQEALKKTQKVGK